MPPIAKPAVTPSPAELTLLRFTGWFEAITLVVLVFVAVPLKYLLASPATVKILGPIHGVAFLIFAGLLFLLWVRRVLGWKAAAVLFVLSFVPFGFVLNGRVLAADRLSRAPGTPA